MSEHFTTVPDHILRQAPAPQMLKDYAQQQWEAILLYLVGSGGGPKLPRELKGNALDIQQLFLSAGLLVHKPSGETSR
jgi:hypothetical protein